MKQLLIFLICLFSLAFADDSQYNYVRDSIFWHKLYANSYETFYCGVNKLAGERVTVEHIYPASWIAESNGCKNREHCPKESYRQASSDLHNLYPALSRYNSSRGNKPYGEIMGEQPRFKDDTCDFERTSGRDSTVEPRDSIKGDISRSMLYMIWRYDLHHHDQLPLLVRWHLSDPVNDSERSRNNRIEELQGNRNPFIDSE